MTFYNLINGRNTELVMVLSAIVGYRIDEEFPRFRDAFMKDDESPYEADYFVYTRMGGGNRECWEGCTDKEPCAACQADAIEEWDTCVGSYDDEFDRTYRTFCMVFTEDQKKMFGACLDGDEAVINKLCNIANEMYKT